MNYEEFKQDFIDEVTERIHEQDPDMRVSENTVNKLNESYDAVTITPDGANVGVNLSINKFFDSYEEGKSFDELVDRAVETANRALLDRPDFDVDSFRDYELMKDKLVMEVVSSQANEDLLKTIPHKDIEDMSVVYRFVLNSDENGRASILVTNNLLDSMGITPDQLHEDALINAPQLKPAEIKGMTEVLAEMMGREQAEMMGFLPNENEKEQLYVATVPDKIHGAGVLAYQGFMDQAAERAGGDFYILPSSIHEVLIVPDTGNISIKELEDMVKNVNDTQVSPEDKLTDSVYHYDSKEKIFELAEKFQERMEDRDERSAVAKEDKGSVLADLQTKKDEVASTPKKDLPEKAARGKGEESL